MEKSIVHKFYRLFVVWLCGGMLLGVARADTFHLIDGTSITGEVAVMDDKGIVLRQSDGTYGDHLPWTKITQADLKDIEQNPKYPKAAEYVEPFIEVTHEERVKRTEIEVKDVARLPRPTGHSLVAAMFTSSLGLFTLLVVYAGNLYAAYEVSLFRAQPAGLVCGVAAVAPVVGPIVFLAMPTKLRQKEQSWQAPSEQQLEPTVAAAIAAEQSEVPAQPAEAAGTPGHAPAAPPKSSLPPTKTFPRGQYTFNRRFFETQLPAFFAIARPEAEKDKVLTIKAVRGTFIAQRISRISANELHLQIVRGHASEEVVVPFVEIQEVQLKHKDA